MASPYDIAIHISMTNGVSPVLALIAKDMLGLQTSASKLESAFNKMGGGLKLMAAGAAAIVGGGEAVKAVLDIAEKGQKLIHQQNMLKQAGLDNLQILNLTADAYKRITAAVPTATAADALRVINELRSVTGDTALAEAAAPFALKVEALLNNKTGKDSEGEGFKLWRAMEMKGITTSNPAMTNVLMNALVQDIIGSGGKITADTYQAMAKTGGASWIHASPQFIAGPGSVLAGDLGGDRAGTAMQTLYQLLTGATTMSKQQYEVFKAAGLIDPTKVTTDKGGRINAQPGAIVGSLEHSDNLYDWAQSIRGPLMNLAKGDPKVFESLLAKIGRNRNSIKLLTMFTDPGFGDQIAKDIAIWSQAMGGDEAYNAMVGRPDKIVSQMQLSGGIGARDKQAEDAAKMADYTAVMKGFQTQWESLMMAVGGPVARGMIPMLQGLTAELNKAGSWAEKHPDAVKYTAEVIAAIGAAMVVLGTGAVIAGAAALLPGGIVAVAIAGIGLAISAMAAMNWSAVANGFNVLVAAMESFFHVIAEIPGRLGMPALTSGDASPAGREMSMRFARYGYERGDLGRELDRESARGVAYSNMSTQTVVVNQTSNLVVDGRTLASVVEKYIVNGNRSVDSSSGHDGRADWSPTDANSFH
jgi:hypothetical protein